ncbi:uncharacterized protein [Mytilus edulis]|uniref:uncharacterized protein n=1 Tax=Mytilus edulis TaxID=6550 RepID=UPI0039EFFBD1
MKMVYFKLITFTYLTILLVGRYSEKEIFCSVTSNPAVFGRDVSISCIYNISSTCVENLTRTWTRGQQKDFLFMNGFPTDIAERYKENVISCSEFELKIANFSARDLNDQYRCSVGFNDCELSLTLDPVNMEYHPNGKEIRTEFTLSHDNFSLFVDMSPVYPKPVCRVFYGGKLMTDFITENTSLIKPFYRTKLNMAYKTRLKTCPVEAYATCLIGHTEITLFRSESHNCSDTDGQSQITLNWTDDFIKTVLCILAGICLALVPWSMLRNWSLIMETCKELVNRSPWDWRRPVLATLTTIGSMSCDILTFTEIDKDNHKPIICFVLALVLTFASLVLISNTTTISIRKGFIISCHRLVKRLKNCVFCLKSSQDTTTNNGYSAAATNVH